MEEGQLQLTFTEQVRDLEQAATMALSTVLGLIFLPPGWSVPTCPTSM